MKLRTMMVAALAALTLAACSNDGDKNNDGPGERATLNVSITSDAVGARAVGPNPADQIEDYNVFVTNGMGEIEWKQYSPDTNPINGMVVSSNAAHVFVVANSGDLTGTITTKAQLDSYLVDITTTAGNQFTSRMATGSTDSPLVFSQGSTSLEANASIKLKFISARITVSIGDNMGGAYDASLGDGSLELQQVAILNAVKESKLFGSSLVPSPVNYLAGVDASASTLWPAGTEINSLYVNTIPQNDFSTRYYYYVFENNAISAGDHPTIVTLVGEFDHKATYYPVHLASYEQWSAGSASVTSVERGKSYNITITLSVDPTIAGGDGGGTTDPTLPDDDVEINIDVQLEDWDPVILNKEF